MIKMTTPISEKDARSLKVGDQVLLSGKIVTGRDAAHKYMVEDKPDFIRPYLKDGVIYHCGPVVKLDEKTGKYSFVSAGPTTSRREEPYQDAVIEEYSIRGVIGKGGMGDKTAAGLAKTGAVYMHAVGGAGSAIAANVKEVSEVFMLDEFGTPEAFWVIDVVDFPVVITMDAHGNSLHKEILEKSAKNLESILREI